MALEDTGGRQTFYGQLPTKNKFGGKIASAGSVKELRYTFDYSDMPATDSGNVMVSAIPAASKIVSAEMKVGTAWVGGTSVAIGLTDLDGTANDPDGLITATQGATANLTAGSIHTGTGTLVGIVGDATAAQAVTSLVVGTYTAGDATLIVKYIPFGADAS